MKRVAMLFNQLGPYHWARLEAAAQAASVIGIELYSKSAEYAWDPLEGASSFERVTLFPDRAAENVPRSELIGRIHEVLDQHAPHAVAIPGWADKGALAALCWCTKHKIPAVLMSESSEHDEPRRWWKESIKRRLVALFSAALVGGRSHRKYLGLLGFPPDRIFEGYDVVDNAHFARGAAVARTTATTLRSTLGLPENYFLASSRFVEKKNLPRLLTAFAAYKSNAGANAWGLVLLGNGPLRHELEERINELQISRAVILPGFKQYPDLPAYYGLAGAFVHASTSEQWGLVVNEAMASGLAVLISNRCGCAPELVIHERNGFTFDPEKTEEMTQLMARVASGGRDLTAMGIASREIIAKYSPDKFGEGLRHGLEAASSEEKQQAGLFGRGLCELLARS